MNEWVWSNGGMILTGENWSTGRKHYTAWVVDEWMSMEQWWNDTDRGKPKCREKNIVQRRWLFPVPFCPKEFLSHCPGNKPRPLHIKSALATARSTITFHRISPLNTTVLTGVMKGITSHLIKWMFKRCLMYTHRRFAVMPFIATRPTRSTATQHPFNAAQT
jgi:hypothetical protein